MKWSSIMLFVLVLFLISCEADQGNTESASHNTHLIKKGETIFSVAQHYKTGIAEIKSLNPKLKDDLSGWNVGVEIILPFDSTIDGTGLGKIENGNTHIIKKGESIFSVAQHYNLRITEIKSLNPQLKDDLSGWNEGVEITLALDSILITE